MKLSKRQLKQIIREEYTRLKRRGLIREGRIGYDEEEGLMPRGATDLMDIAKDAFSYGDGDGIIMHWMQTLGVAAHETGEVDEEDFMAIQRYESQFNPNIYNEKLMKQLMMNLSQDAIDLLYRG